MGTRLTAALATAALFGLSAAASAVTIDVFNDTDVTSSSNSGVGGVAGGLRGTVSCTSACSALYYTAGAYDFGDPGEMFDGSANSNPANEAAWVNSALGTGFSGADFTAGKQDNGNAVISNALYVLMKIGNSPSYLLIRNDAGVSQTFDFAKAQGAKGSLSHSVAFGTVPSIPSAPLPAAGFLLLAGIGGLAAVKRRKKS